MKKGKGEKVVDDELGISGLFGRMKGQIEINGDIFSTGAWPSDEEMIESYNELTTDTESESEQHPRGQLSDATTP